jgi:hypothetical protein
MLRYDNNETQNESHFFIYTEKEEIYILSFSKNDLESDDSTLHSEYLEKRAMEMKIMTVTSPNLPYNKSLLSTMKSIFDNKLSQESDLIIYLSIPTDSCKDNLLLRFIKSDTHQNFQVYYICVQDTSFYFFLNIEKTNAIESLREIGHYFKSEYDIDLKMLND